MAKQPVGRSGTRISWRSSSVGDAAGPGVSPQRSCSSERTAFCSASLNVRPIAITSPTDFIWVVSVAVRLGELLEGPARDLHHAVVDGRLEGAPASRG